MAPVVAVAAVGAGTAAGGAGQHRHQSRELLVGRVALDYLEQRRDWRCSPLHATNLKDLPPALHEALWGAQSFYRVSSTVNGGRRQETDLFEGLR